MSDSTEEDLDVVYVLPPAPPRWLMALQWPAMVLSVAGAALVADPSASVRLVGFVLFLLANLTWLVWGWGTRAWALVIMQALFTITSLRGIWSNV